MSKKNSLKDLTIEYLSFEENCEEISFDDAPTGKTIISFSFEETSDLTENSIPRLNKNIPTPKIFTNIVDNRLGKTDANGVTPTIDGESFDIKRGYVFRKSTIRKLNELKAIHSDINVYLNTLIDEAIVHYYNSIFSENNSSTN